MSEGFIILSGNRTIYSSGDLSSLSVDKAPVGKGKTQKPKSTKVRASAKTSSEVLYPFFKEFSETTDDVFWKSLFADAAVGKFPRGFRYQHGVLSYKIKSKIYEKYISLDNHQDALKNIKDFMGEHAGIISSIDTEEKQKEIQSRITSLLTQEINNWNQIRSPTHKMILVSKYLDLLEIKNKLTKKQKEETRSQINIGIVIGYFNNENIIIKDGLISKIEGLIWDVKSKKFIIDTKNIKLKNKKSTKKAEENSDEYSDNSFIKTYIKFFETLDKRTSKFISSSATPSVI